MQSERGKPRDRELLKLVHSSRISLELRLFPENWLRQGKPRCGWISEQDVEEDGRLSVVKSQAE